MPLTRPWSNASLSLLSCADVQTRRQCRAGGSVTPAPRAEPQGIDRCGPSGVGMCAVTHRLARSSRPQCRVNGVGTLAPHPPDLMSFIVFILLGLAVCAFTHAVFNRRPSAVIVNLGVGVMGAVTAGSLFNHVAATGAARLSITDALVAAITGAVVLLAACHATLRWMR